MWLKPYGFALQLTFSRFETGFPVILRLTHRMNSNDLEHYKVQGTPYIFCYSFGSHLSVRFDVRRTRVELVAILRCVHSVYTWPVSLSLKVYSVFSSALCYCTARLLSSRGRPSSVKPIFSEPVKQINAKFSGKVPFHHISRLIFCFSFCIFDFLWFFFRFR